MDKCKPEYYDKRETRRYYRELIWERYMKNKMTVPVGILVGLAVFMVAAYLSEAFGYEGVPQNAPLESFTMAMDERIPELMRRYDIPGVGIALVKDGKLVFTSAYGYADLEDDRVMTVDLPMRVQSISKPVTAWGVMKLVEKGLIDPDKPVTEYIKTWEFPASAYPADEITVRQLLSHTSGLPLGDVFNIYAPSEIVPSLRDSLTESAISDFAPGTGFSYSNVGYNVLELLIEEVTGMDFSAYMENEVLRPLAMGNSTFVCDDLVAKTAPVGYSLNGTAVPVYVYPEKASGGLFASAGDIARFLIAGMPAFNGNPVLDSQSIEYLYTPQADGLGVYDMVFESYGSGFYLEHLKDGNLAVAHGGQGTGLMTHFHAVPKTGDAIVILTNSQRSWPFFANILKDWAGWCGFDTIGMERLLLAQAGLWTFICLLLFFALSKLIRMIVEIMNGKRQLKFNHMGIHQVIPLGASLTLFSVLLWSMRQRYLFVSSVFPVAAPWLGIGGFIFAAMLSVSALFTLKDG